MDHQDLEDTAQCMFQFVPKWARPTMDKILAICTKHQVGPAVYLRAFANNTKQSSGVWHAQHVILAAKWQEFIPAALQELETEATVTYEHDALVFLSTLAIEGDPEVVINSPGADMSAMGRVSYARKYHLSEAEDKWINSAMKEAKANPCLADKYSFWHKR